MSEYQTYSFYLAFEHLVGKRRGESEGYFFDSGIDVVITPQLQHRESTLGEVTSQAEV